ncbi:hypothetical protein DFH29DRAFT_1003832 [Suillus ampliporus]|nr:hypothetical protein DFH29DRAFT_1003832 [Suillus ampliporus]
MRKHLHSFHLIVPSGDHRRTGFDASAWGVLSSLTNLRSLYITYPRDLSLSLAGRLIPRSVRALTMDIIVPPAEDLLLFINQSRPGVPPLLTFIGMTNFPIHSVINVIDQGFLGDTALDYFKRLNADTNAKISVVIQWTLVLSFLTRASVGPLTFKNQMTYVILK